MFLKNENRYAIAKNRFLNYKVLYSKCCHVNIKCNQNQYILIKKWKERFPELGEALKERSSFAEDPDQLFETANQHLADCAGGNGHYRYVKAVLLVNLPVQGADVCLFPGWVTRSSEITVWKVLRQLFRRPVQELRTVFQGGRLHRPVHRLRTVSLPSHLSAWRW